MSGTGAAASAPAPRTLDRPYFVRRLGLEAAPRGPRLGRAERTLLLGPAALLGALRRAWPVDALEIEAGLETSEAALADALARLPAGSIDRLVDLRGLGPSDPDPAAAATAGACAVLRLARALSGAAQPIADVVLLTACGDLGLMTGPGHSPATAARSGAMAGAWKSVARELSADGRTLRARHIDASPAWSADSELLQALADELLRQGPAEVALQAGGSRVTPVLRAADLDGQKLDRGAVAVITGGARGIVARLSHGLAAAGVRLVLVGRTAPAADAALCAAPDPQRAARDAARRVLGADAGGAAVTEHGKELLRQAEVRQSLDALAAAGAEVCYVRGDARDPAVLGRAVAEARQRYGRLDVVLHGAGIDKSRSLSSKSEAEVAEVVAAKLAGAALFAAAPEALAVAIGSVSGRFGNAGQIDYAAANDALAKVALGRGGLVLDYSAWEGVGMAAPLARAMRERGVDPLDPEAAAAASLALLLGGARGEWMLSGRLAADEPRATLGGELRLDVPGSEVERAATLELESTPWLWDHRPTSGGVLPTVVGLAAMIDAGARLAPELILREVRDLRLDRPLKAFAGRPLSVVVEARRGGAPDGVLRVVAGVGDGAAVQQHAELLFGEAAAAPVATTPPQDLRPGPGSAEIYRTFFHGPSFQVLGKTELGDGAARATLAPGPELGRGIPEAQRPLAMARELALQAAGVYLMTAERRLALPVGIEVLRCYAAPAADEAVQVVVRARGGDAERFVLDAELIGADGRLLERLEGMSFQKLAALPQGTVAVAQASAT